MNVNYACMHAFYSLLRIERATDCTTFRSTVTTPASHDAPPEELATKFMEDIVATARSATTSFA